VTVWPNTEVDGLTDAVVVVGARGVVTSKIESADVLPSKPALPD
jgi:hypothetical protein